MRSLVEEIFLEKKGIFVMVYYKIVSAATGKALDVPNFSTADGTLIDQWGDNGGANQHWQLVDVGNGLTKIVTSLAAGKVLLI